MIGTQAPAWNSTIASSLFVGVNPRRNGLLISAPPGITVTISYTNPAILGQGITLQNNQFPFKLKKG